MDMLSWARNEIKLFMQPQKSCAEFDYCNDCAESALKAFESLCADGHSGMSINVTKGILDALIDGRPLTSITEKDFDSMTDVVVYNKDILKSRGLKNSIQCPRMSSLFQDVHLDGTVTYHDIDRVVTKDENNLTWHDGTASNIIDEMFPITLPYTPPAHPYIVYASELSNEPGTFIGKHYEFVVTPDAQTIDLDIFYIEDESGWTQVNKKQYKKFAKKHGVKYHD